MKHFGYTSFTLTSVFILGVISIRFFVPELDYLNFPLTLSAMIVAWQTFNMPLIKINTERISIFTLNPFSRNTNVHFADVSKIIVDLDHTMRVVFQMKDGTYRSINTSRYSYDMKPFYYELTKSGVDIVSEGADTIDWVR